MYTNTAYPEILYFESAKISYFRFWNKENNYSIFEA